MITVHVTRTGERITKFEVDGHWERGHDYGKEACASISAYVLLLRKVIGGTPLLGGGGAYTLELRDQYHDPERDKEDQLLLNAVLECVHTIIKSTAGAHIQVVST